jgi:hypothetical protein
MTIDSERPSISRQWEFARARCQVADDPKIGSGLADQNGNVRCHQTVGVGVRHDRGEVELLHERRNHVRVFNAKR